MKSKKPKPKGLSRKEWNEIWLKVSFNPFWNPDRRTIEKNIETLVNEALKSRKGGR